MQFALWPLTCSQSLRALFRSLLLGKLVEPNFDRGDELLHPFCQQKCRSFALTAQNEAEGRSQPKGQPGTRTGAAETILKIEFSRIRSENHGCAFVLK